MVWAWFAGRPLPVGFLWGLGVGRALDFGAPCGEPLAGGGRGVGVCGQPGHHWRLQPGDYAGAGQLHVDLGAGFGVGRETSALAVDCERFAGRIVDFYPLQCDCGHSLAGSVSVAAAGVESGPASDGSLSAGVVGGRGAVLAEHLDLVHNCPARPLGALPRSLSLS